MKHILFTDLHVGLNINNETWYNLPIKAVEHLTRTARRKNIKSIIFCGDFYHDRKELSVKAIDSARIICEMLSEFKTYIICGNHDAYFKNTIELNSLQTIDKFENITIVTKPMVAYEKIGLCPWSLNYRELNTPILMGHFDIKDFKMNDNTSSIHGEDIKSFKDYKLVISGHFHTHSKKGNVVYLGNMYGHNFNDVDSTRGYWIFDDESLDMEFVEFEDSPKFIKVIDMDFVESKIKGNIVKVILTKEYSEQNIIDYLTKLNSLEPLEIDVDYSRIKIDDVQMDISEDINISSLDEKQIFHDYLDKITIPDHLKVNTCKKIIDDLFTSTD